MNNQLVIQFSGKNIDDFDTLIKIEEILEQKLKDNADVDGHDFGSGEMNIFIYTEDPLQTFLIVKDVVSSLGLLQNMRAAYREEDEGDYKILWPQDLKKFDII